MRCFNQILIYTVTFGLMVATTARAETPVKLRFPLECTLAAIAKKRNVQLSENVPLPTLYYESTTSFETFKAAVMQQGHDFPQEFSNAYVYVQGKNDIFLIDSPSYYARHGRFIDDSLAHEIAHYVQVRYQKYDLNVEEFAELEAVDLQTWYRDTFMVPASGPSPCDDLVKK